MTPTILAFDVGNEQIFFLILQGMLLSHVQRTCTRSQEKLSSRHSRTQWKGRHKEMKICIDAGHGMGNRQAGIYDPGACHVYEHKTKNIEEADINLEYALELESIVKREGLSAFLTRRTKWEPCQLRSRVSRAKAAGCNRLVSFHVNEAENDNATGVEVLYRDEKYRKYAQFLCEMISSVSGLKSRGAKHRSDLAILALPVPAVLIELGFICNDEDMSIILNDSIKEKICSVIFDSTKQIVF